MRQGHVDENDKNLRLLLNAWTMARENDRAIDTIDKIAQLADDGEVYRRKALLLNETGEWEAVVESCRLALQKGGLENPAKCGCCKASPLPNWALEEAINAFENAKRGGTDNVRRDANAWIGYVEDRSRGSS